MKRVVGIFLLTLIMVVSLSGLAVSAPTVVLNGQTLSFDTLPIIENGSTLVPLRAIFEPLGAQVEWDSQTQTVLAYTRNTEIKLILGHADAYVNGVMCTLSTPAKSVNGRTMVPLRFVSNALGAEVKWDEAAQVITINGEVSSTPMIKSAARVHFIDVGQGEAIYIQLPEHNDILIDAGDVAAGPRVVDYLKDQGVDDLELLVATVPKAEHIGGLPAVFDNFTIEKIIDCGKSVRESKIYDDYISSVKAEGCLHEQDNYQNLIFGGSKFEILTGPQSWDFLNDFSVICRLNTGNIRFLFTSEAEAPAEAALQGDISAEILKVGNYGSDSASSPAFLSRVNPKAAVMSVASGANARQPAYVTIAKLKIGGSDIFRTDLNGNIVFTTDGDEYRVACSRP